MGAEPVRAGETAGPVDRNRIWCAVPVRNNAATVRRVVEGCLRVLKNVVVVDDGSTDADVVGILAGLPVAVLRHPKNLGKGAAILTAARHARDNGAAYLVTIDADGQHDPSDIEKLLPLIRADGRNVVIGCREFDSPNVPASSRFGREFGNFWLMVQTGVRIGDCQSGLRAYPVAALTGLKFRGRRFDFEAEVLARTAWAGLNLVSVPVGVWYAPPGRRVSSFRPFLDNFRFSLMHASLVGRRLVPWPHPRLFPAERPDFSLLLHPVRALKMLAWEHATPGGLAAASAVGVLLATLPFFFSHTIVILYVATRLNLNKVVAVNVQHFCAPPFVPALCIEVGYYLRHGRWLTDLTWATFTREAPARVGEWVIGSFVVAPVLAVLAGALAYGAARAFRIRDAGREGTPPAAERSRGPRLGIAFFRILLATLGLRPAYGLLNLVCLHYLLFDAPARGSSLAYIRRRFPELGAWGRFWAAHRLLVSQGIVLVDRYYQESGSGSFDMELKGYAETAEAAGKSGKGFVLLTSHVGSWQVAMAALGRMDRTVHLLMKPEANPAVKEAFGLSSGADRIRIISPDGHLGGVLECIKALDLGDVVAIMGDRSYGAETVETGFLGGRVGFPFGAFSIASAARVPVVVLLSARTGYRRYLVDFSKVILPGTPYRDVRLPSNVSGTGRGGRREDIARCVREYAGILEEYVAQYPYQWFVFYDIWEHGARDAAAGDATTKETTRNAG